MRIDVLVLVDKRKRERLGQICGKTRGSTCSNVGRHDWAGGWNKEDQIQRFIETKVH